MRIIADWIEPSHVFIIGDHFKVVKDGGFPIYDESDTIEITDSELDEIHRTYHRQLAGTFSRYLKDVLLDKGRKNSG